MKTLVAVVSAFTFVFYLGSTTAYARQGKGGHRGFENHGRAGDREVRREERREERREVQREDRRENRRDEKFEDRLDRNPALRAKVQELLPPGTDARTAANGFKNHGQFIAALHVSRNLDIPFNQLKARMTGPNHMSLGQAIHDLRPNIPEKQAHREVERAERQGKETEKGRPTT
jgi:hypothetical protein